MVIDLLNELGDRVSEEFGTPVTIEDCEAFPKVSDLYSDKRTWKRMREVVVVVVDLKGSTNLNFKTYAPTSASLYEAVTGNCSRIVETFSPVFVDIQGDGLFALYHGERAYERAFCAAVTLKTFSEKKLGPAIESQLGERFPKTGLKVGMAAGILAAKRVGVRGHSEPVWAGKPVNWASKLAQHADAHELVVAEKVFKQLEDNQYARYSCGCRGGVPGAGSPTDLWHVATNAPSLGDRGTPAWMLMSCWCDNCGDEFCDAILTGQKDRGL